MFKAKKTRDPVEDLQERVAYLEGLTAGLLQYDSNRATMVRCVREKTPAGSVERALTDLILTMEREAFAKTFAGEVKDIQQTGHHAFISVMSRSLRS